MFWYWLAAGVVIMILEIFAPGVIFLWLGIAAVATGVIVLLAPALSIEIQALIFAILAVLSVVAGRMIYKSTPETTDHPGLNRRAQRYMGEVYRLLEPTQEGRSRVKIGDTVWNVVIPDPAMELAEGAEVRVTGDRGTVLVVEPNSTEG
jgi:membrane protein implicated in regulation of membrane protease activity